MKKTQKFPKMSQYIAHLKKKTQKFPKLSQYIFYIYALESPSLEIFKRCLDVVLGNLFWVVLLEQEGWIRQPAEVPSNHSLIL